MYFLRRRNVEERVTHVYGDVRGMAAKNQYVTYLVAGTRAAISLDSVVNREKMTVFHLFIFVWECRRDKAHYRLLLMSFFPVVDVVEVFFKLLFPPKYSVSPRPEESKRCEEEELIYALPPLTKVAHFKLQLPSTGHAYPWWRLCARSPPISCSTA